MSRLVMLSGLASTVISELLRSFAFFFIVLSISHMRRAPKKLGVPPPKYTVSI